MSTRLKRRSGRLYSLDPRSRKHDDTLTRYLEKKLDRVFVLQEILLDDQLAR